MKICHIATGFPLSFQGGITNYVRSLAEYQCKTNNEVYILSGKDKTDGFAYNVKCYESKKIHPRLVQSPVDKKGLDEVRLFLEQEKFDVIHIHMALDIDWDLYEILKPYHYVVSLHDYYFICPRIQMLRSDNSVCESYDREKCSKCISKLNTVSLFSKMEYIISHKTSWKKFHLPQISQNMTEQRYQKFKKLLENADMLLPVSSRVQEIFENSNIRGEYKVLHIGNITADKFREDYSFDYSKEKIDIAMLGTLSYLKGGDLFIQLAEKLDKNRVRVHFYGRSSSYSERLKKAGIIDHGPYKQEDLPEILANTDLGLVLSVWEDNGPQVVMEFLNNHIPVVGTRMGGIPDFVKNKENGLLFNPFSQKEIDLVINQLNSMNRDDVYRLTSAIKRTTTTEEHCRDIDIVYTQVVSERR